MALVLFLQGDKDAVREKGTIGGWVQSNWLGVLPLGTLRGGTLLASLKVWRPLSLLLPSWQLSKQVWWTGWGKLLSPAVAESPSETLRGSFPRGRGVVRLSLQTDMEDRQTDPFSSGTWVQQGGNCDPVSDARIPPQQLLPATTTIIATTTTTNRDVFAFHYYPHSVKNLMRLQIRII